MKTVLALRDAGVDTEGALRRLGGNSGVYEKFLFKFLEDENFSLIGPALKQGNLDTALKSSHTLKGVSANLGMERLSAACAQIVNLIRSGEMTDAEKVFQELEEAYLAVCNALSLESK